MTSKATYRGEIPVFGVTRGDTYTIDLRTVSSEHGAPYLWVRVQERPDYLMPYESVGALISEWDFTTSNEDEFVEMRVGHRELVEQWLEIYVPCEM